MFSLKVNSIAKLVLECFASTGDGYKYSHPEQYPPNTKKSYMYMEARGSIDPKYAGCIVFGLQYYLKKYLEGIVITPEMVQYIGNMIEKSGLPFYYDGWMYIANELGGKLPIEIKALPEGTFAPLKNALFVIENTDEKCFWLPSFLETMLEKIWYPCEIATNSFLLRKLIWEYVNKTVDNPELDMAFKLHDFGARSGTSEQSVQIGALSHLLSFSGTDTMSALFVADAYYNSPDPIGFTIPAMEHTTIISWGRENEVLAYKNMLEKMNDFGLIALVIDSYDSENALRNIFGKELKDMIVARGKEGKKTVFRPDSGDPVTIALEYAKIIEDTFGCTVNEKGYKVFNDVKLIMSDSITWKVIETILSRYEELGYSAENVNFGMGGALLTKGFYRDFLGFAIKCSCVDRDGIEYNICKDPITSSFKKSKAGKQKVIFDKNGELITVPSTVEGMDQLVTIFKNGELIMDESYDTIKNRVQKIPLK